MRCTVPALFVLFILTCCAVFAAVPALSMPSAFSQRQGENGWDDIAAAADLLSGSEAFAATQQPGGATLAVKRQALSDPAVARARYLVRVGLSRPLLPPPSSPDQMPGNTNHFPHFAKARQVARLLAVEQYVLMADGKTDAAVDSLRDGLRLSYFIKTHALIGGLVGTAMETIWLRGMAERIDQLSARDCERLLAAIQTYLKAPDPVITALEQERRDSIRIMSHTLQAVFDAASTPEFAEIPDDSEDITPAVRAEMLRLKNDPAARDTLRMQMVNRLNRYYDALIEQARHPAKAHAPLLPKTADSSAAGPGSFIDATMKMMYPTGARSAARLAQSQAQLRLMAVHAAIRRYRWEHDRLPASLADLKLGALAIDPFTQKELTYRITGETAYTLSSVGPRKLDEEGEPVADERETVTLPLPRRNAAAPMP